MLAPLYQAHLKAVFIDEAHCIDMWGSGKEPFRRAYRKLGDLRSFLPSDIPFVALTATATHSTRKDIIHSLGLSKAVAISVSPNRNNIMYHIQASSEDVTVTFKWIIEDCS